ncbi:MAG: hybrid sensor histidine kinase/response regulator [Planctomycetota bacterium]|jgi:PAS domain S-box-containing protein
MNHPSFDAQLSRLRARLAAFERHLGAGTPAALALGTEALEDAQGALEELQISDVELRQQNAALAAAQDDLVQQRRQFQELFDFAPVGYLVTDRDAVVRMANRAAATMLGVEPAVLIGKPLARFVVASGRPAFEALLRRVLHHGAPRELAVELCPRERQLFPAELRLSVGPGPDGQGALRWVLSDVTDRMVAAAAERRAQDRADQAGRLESLGLLAGGIAHDFGNIVTGIALSAEVLLQRLSVDDVARRLSAEIGDAARRARTLIDGLLLFARGAPQAADRLDVNDEVTRLTPIVKRLLPAGVELRASLTPGLPPIVMGHDHLERILVNLTLNACDAMPGGGTLDIESRHPTPAECAQHPVAASAVAVVVGDSGVGMDTETQALVFDPFFSTKPLAAGSGLGLSSVYGIVTGAGGHIALESRPGAGARFTLFFPSTATAVLSSAPRPPRAGARPAAVLFVDDDSAIRQAARALLSARGDAVLLAGDGPEAIRLLADPTHAIDLLITDLLMPGMSGRVVAQTMWADRPDVPVLFISGHADTPGPGAGGRSDARTAFLRKPFNSTAFLGAVDTLLAR